MVSCYFKVSVIVGAAFSVWDFVTDIMATYDFHQTLKSYRKNAEDMVSEISGTEASNFKADSEWFTTISAEYDALSSFDKENIYCDIHAIQSEPDALVTQSEQILIAACSFVGLSLIALVTGYCVLIRIIRTKEIENDKGETGAREKLFNFVSKSAIQFCEDGPLLTILVLMMIRHGKLDGYECQEKFFNCGVSGECKMQDLMVPVPLNSSLLDLATADWILAVSFAAGIVNVLYNCVNGIMLFVGEDTPKLLVMPFLQFCLSMLPLMWVTYIDGLVTTGRTDDTEAKVFIAITIGISVCLCCSICAWLWIMRSDSVMNKEINNMNRCNTNSPISRRSRGNSTIGMY